MKEQALKIVSDLIDNYKINGKDAVTLIIAISDNSNPQYVPGAPIVSNPLQLKDFINPHASNQYPDNITTTTTGNITDDIITTRPKGMEIIYGNE